jgi:hypothetical protein
MRKEEEKDEQKCWHTIESLCCKAKCDDAGADHRIYTGKRVNAHTSKGREEKGGRGRWYYRDIRNRRNKGENTSLYQSIYVSLSKDPTNLTFF